MAETIDTDKNKFSEKFDLFMCFSVLQIDHDLILLLKSHYCKLSEISNRRKLKEMHISDVSREGLKGIAYTTGIFREIE